MRGRRGVLLLWIWRPSLMIDSFTSDWTNGLTRRGKMALGGNKATGFNGGGEYTEAAASDCCSHTAANYSRSIKIWMMWQCGLFLKKDKLRYSLHSSVFLVHCAPLLFSLSSGLLTKIGLGYWFWRLSAFDQWVTSFINHNRRKTI